MRNKIILVVCLWVLIPFNIVLSQTLHSIIVANTLDTAISSSCLIDQGCVFTELQTITQVLKYKNNCQTIQDDEFKIDMIEKAIDGLQCGKNDVIFFYYTGHGARASKDNNIWPQLSINMNGENKNENYLPLLTIFNLLKAKNPRLLIVFGDCCNNVSQKLLPKALTKGQTVVENNTRLVEVFKNLFVDSKGTILISSSKPGETSIAFKDQGSLFTINYFKTLAKTLSGEMVCSWDSLLSHSKEMTKSTAQKYNESQEPLYELNLTKNTDTITPLPTGDLIEIVNGLLDCAKSPSERIKMISTVQENVFSNSEVIVETYGINKTTLIEREKAKDFLKRLATSIDVVVKVIEISSEKDNSGKYTKLKIHEIIKI